MEQIRLKLIKKQTWNKQNKESKVKFRELSWFIEASAGIMFMLTWKIRIKLQYLQASQIWIVH